MKNVRVFELVVEMSVVAVSAHVIGLLSAKTCQVVGSNIKTDVRMSSSSEHPAVRNDSCPYLNAGFRWCLGRDHPSEHLYLVIQIRVPHLSCLTGKRLRILIIDAP